jgi:HAD superfamily hydrolase (TIGR01509 family)
MEPMMVPPMSTPGLRAILWDVDGTLAETERDGHLPAFNLAFEGAGLPWRWDAARYGELLDITGGRERILHDLVTQPMAPSARADREALALRLHQQKNSLYAQRMQSHPIPLRPGVRELLGDSRDRKILQGITTTTSRTNVEALLAPHLGEHWYNWFEIILCGEDVSAKKPDPEVYAQATAHLLRLGITRDQILAIEDSPNGVRAASSAGLAVILTRSTYFMNTSSAGTCADGGSFDEPTSWLNERTTERPPTRTGARIDLDDLIQWHAAYLASGGIRSDTRD